MSYEQDIQDARDFWEEFEFIKMQRNSCKKYKKLTIDDFILTDKKMINRLCPFCTGVKEKDQYGMCKHTIYCSFYKKPDVIWHPQLLPLLKNAYLYKEIEDKCAHLSCEYTDLIGKGVFAKDVKAYIKKFKYAYKMKDMWGIDV